MKNDHKNRFVKFIGPETEIKLNRFPNMAGVFLNALRVSLFRPNDLFESIEVPKVIFQIKNVMPDPRQLMAFQTICGVSQNGPETIPIPYFQTLFVSLLGKFISSKYFPISPLGLIHVFQSLKQNRGVALTEPLDLSCTLSDMTHTPKGIESKFDLRVTTKGEPVWQGSSIFLTKDKAYKRAEMPKHDSCFLKKREIITVPSGTGRKYARASGDYNPHHLYPILAQCFGFKTAIAHGMWSLARVVSSLDAQYHFQKDSVYIETYFKRPIFMPATLALGYEKQPDITPSQKRVNFELKSNTSGIPHLKGHFVKTERNL